MKDRIPAILCIFYFTFSLSIPARTQGSFKVQGKIASDSVLAISIGADPFYSPFEPGTEIILKNQSYSISAQIEKPVSFELLIPGNVVYLFLEPGDDISIAEDGSGGYIFSGTGGGKCQVLNDFRNRFAGQFGIVEMKSEMMKNAIDMYEMSLFANRKTHRQAWKNAASGVNLSEPFRKFMETLIEYNYHSLLAAYPVERSRSNPESKELKNLPSIMEEEFKDELLNVDDALNCPSYRNYIDYYTIYYTSKTNGFQKFTDFSESFLQKEKQAQMKLTGDTYCWYVSQLLYHDCGKGNPSVIKKLYSNVFAENLAMAKIIYAKCGEWMETKVEKEEIAGVSGKGKPAMEEEPPSGFAEKKFVLADMEGNPVSLKEFRGKVVYLDFWASWCGPCVRQFPFSKSLHESFSAKELKELVFLYISLDDGEDKWKEAVKRLGLEGVQTILKNGWNSEGAMFYHITSIPRYMIMDKKGGMVDTNAPRPGMEGIRDKLLELLAE